MTEVVLKPKIIFSGIVPTKEQLDELHHRAHEKCYIANSVRTKDQNHPCMIPIISKERPKHSLKSICMVPVQICFHFPSRTGLK